MQFLHASLRVGLLIACILGGQSSDASATPHYEKCLDPLIQHPQHCVWSTMAERVRASVAEAMLLAARMPAIPGTPMREIALMLAVFPETAATVAEEAIVGIGEAVPAHSIQKSEMEKR